MSKTTEAKRNKGDEDKCLSEEQRHHCIEVAAYYIAEKNPSEHCCDVENWLVAEAQVAQLMAEGKL